MRIMIITDAWEPQVNGVVRTLKQTRTELIGMGHQVDMITPQEFKTIPCPTYPDISLSLFPAKKLAERIKGFAPDAMHIATEGPLGLAARAYGVRNHLPFPPPITPDFQNTYKRVQKFLLESRTDF